jgi:limonene-1,2-epoxide hydrolase
MISDTFKIREFLKAVEDMDYHEIIKAAQRECRLVDNISFGVKGAVKARKMGSGEYMLELKSFIHFLANEVHALSETDKANPLYRSVCESLVRRGQLPASILAGFQ